jgi:hypothetical protein
MKFGRSEYLTLATCVLLESCQPEVKQEAPASKIVLATFSGTALPTPNDLAMAAANPIANPPLPDGLQKELLTSFIAQGGFPSDQAQALSVPLSAFAWDAASNAYVPASSPTVDIATLSATSAVLLKIDVTPPQRIALEAPPAQSAGAITLLPKADASGSRRLAPGRYVFAVRGGAAGAKTTDGLAIAPDLAVALTLPNKSLAVPDNQPPGGLGADQASQLEQVRSVLWQPVAWATMPIAAGVSVWAPCTGLAAATPACTGLVPVTSSAYAAIDAAFPHDEVASIATFSIAPAAVTPLTDATSGQVPFPSNFLLDSARPVPGSGSTRFYVRNLPAFGAAAAGLATLDGFSTTGMLTAALSGPVQADTINGSTVFLFELPEQAGPPRKMVDVQSALAAGAPGSAEYLLEPPALTRTIALGAKSLAVTTAIGLQPGVPVPTPTAAGILYLPPLKQKTNYLVVITDGVKDLAGNSLRRSTLANILLGFKSSPVAGGHSAIPGVSDADATALLTLRTSLAPVLSAIGPLTGTSLTQENVVMAYTVQTQTVTDASVNLSALPYAAPDQSVAFNAVGATAFDPATLGLPSAGTSVFSHIDSFLGTSIVTLNPITPATGALNPDTTQWTPTPIPALLTIPKTPDTCTATAPCPLPLVIVHHGLGGGRLQTLALSDSLAAQGFVVAAIDAPYHGDRAFCAKSSDCTTNGTDDGVCTPDPTKAGQGDAVPPGTCTTGHLKGNTVDTKLTTVASGNYFISANFFRLRDALRQDVLDHAALVLALARPPAPFPQPTSNAVAEALLAKGIVVNPAAVYFEGLSLGGIAGTSILATNPRFARGVLNAPGGTLVDVFANAPAFTAEADALFLSMGIDRSKVDADPAVAAAYLQTLIVAKWILDPADPINYAGHVLTKLASPLTDALGAVAHATTSAYGQLAACDQVVPNASTVVSGVPLPYGDLLLHLGSLPSTLYSSTSAAGQCIDHGTLADTFSAAPKGEPMRADAASFLSSLTTNASTFALP